jgi:serine/threonine protein kinase/Tfp pilus assembly protein PilF
MSLSAGARLGPYEILGLLGSGGMGEVYRARDPRLRRDVAIKILSASLAEDPEALARFEREARAVAALSHPNILAIHDLGREGSLSYAVTELLEGETLRAALSTGPLPARRCAEIGIAVGEALAAAHSRGIVHRDIKPENVFLTSDGRVKLLDFGLARPVAATAADAGSAAATLEGTRPGTVLGTTRYMSPEQARGEQVDERSDIFSLGCVLYEMLTGERAFPGESVAEILTSLLRDDPPGLRDASPLPEEAVPILRHALEKNRSRRYQSATDFAFALRRLALEGTAAAARSPDSRAIDSLAVLPFANASADPELDYLSDGISENLMNALSQLPELKVIARNSAFRYKGTSADPAAVARTLGVRSVVTGRVLQRGERLSVSVELVDAREDRHLWGEQYHRRLADIFEIQEEISRDIASKLRLRLAGSGAPSLKRHTEDPEAYRLYLRGRYYWNKRPQPEFSQALDCYQQAIERDPTFALAFTGIADYYSSLGSWEFGGLPPREAFPRARAAIDRALAIDDSLAEAHTSLGHLRLYYEWDAAGSEASFARALELNPHYTNAHHYLSHLYLTVGRVSESLAESQRAIDLDPLDQILQAHLAWHYVFARQYDQAIEQCGRTQEMGDNFWSFFFRGFSLEQKGDLDAAIGVFSEAQRRSPGSTFALTAAAHAHGLAGRRKEALLVREELLRRRFVPSYDQAIIHLALGEREEALEALERAFEEQSTWMAYLGLDPRLDPLRGQPRFEALVRRVGLAA